MPQWSGTQTIRRMLRVLAVAGACLVWSAGLATQSLAQQGSDKDEFSKRVTKQRDASGAELPTRVSETRTQDGNRTSRKQVIEAQGPDGRYQPLLEREEEVVEVDGQTTRTVVKEYGRNADGTRSLLRQTEEETLKLGDGKARTTRSISRPDVNGRTQAVEKAVEDSAETGPDTREVRKTVLLPDANGDFQAADQVYQIEHKEGGVTEVTASHSRPDNNGRWGTYEVSKKTLQQGDDGTEASDERVSRRDLNDRESLKERTVSRKWKDASGEEHETTETYSRANSGANVADSSRLPLAQRTMGVTITDSDGSQRVVQSVEQRSQGNSSDGMRVAQQSLEVSRPDDGGRQAQRTVKIQDQSGRLKDTIVVDFEEKK